MIFRQQACKEMVLSLISMFGLLMLIAIVLLSTATALHLTAHLLTALHLTTHLFSGLFAIV